jgi:hypothetical protein
LYITNIESEKISDHFLELIKENSEYSLLPNEVNLSSDNNIINYLYNNINTFIPLNEHRYSLIYMIVKYAYNKEIIENEEESNENKEFAKNWNETFEDLTGNLYSIDETDRIFRSIKRNNELAKENINLFFEAIRRARVDILEIMRRYLPKYVSENIINKAFRWAAENGHIKVLEWLKKTFDIKKRDAKNVKKAFRLAANNRHLDVLKWLKEKFNITKEEATSKNNYVFRYATWCNDQNMLKWLKDTYNITEKEVKSYDKYASRFDHSLY